MYDFLVSLNNIHLYQNSLYSIGDFFYFKCDYWVDNTEPTKLYSLDTHIKEIKSIAKKRLVDIKFSPTEVVYNIAVGKKNNIKCNTVEINLEESTLDLNILKWDNPDYIQTIDIEVLRDLYHQALEQVWAIKYVELSDYFINTDYIKLLLKLMDKLELLEVNMYKVQNYIGFENMFQSVVIPIT